MSTTKSPNRGPVGPRRPTPDVRTTYVVRCEECGVHTRNYRTFACSRMVTCPLCKRITEHA